MTQIASQVVDDGAGPRVQPRSSWDRAATRFPKLARIHPPRRAGTEDDPKKLPTPESGKPNPPSNEAAPKDGDSKDA